jgi:hypothetical protein
MAAKNTNQMSWDPDLLYCVHSKGIRHPGVIHWYKGVKYENNFFKAKIYVVLISPQFSRDSLCLAASSLHTMKSLADVVGAKDRKLSLH